ncbi:MAG: hypothetical protein F6K55_39500, partial [Moorea sp. SIO4A3]|nr:hypothetical protein [Moorena sp. SIO4A3]
MSDSTVSDSTVSDSTAINENTTAVQLAEAPAQETSALDTIPPLPGNRPIAPS